MMEYGCIGEKLSHSFSAEIHRRLFDYTYELREIPREELDAFMRRREFRAVNVTIPYKEAVIPYLDEIEETARRIGAVNTVVRHQGRLYGYNTDFSGMCAMLEYAALPLAGKRVLVLGSGGTSKTAEAVARHNGCAEVRRVSRSGRDGCITYEEALCREDTEVIINTTPIGTFPKIGESVVDIAAFPRLTGVVDAVYNPLRSKLVCDARARGIPACGGLYMLVAQAAFAAERFTGVEVSQEKIRTIFEELKKEKENVVLIGMPSSGKTTVGGLLAQRLGRVLIDTDREIEKREGCTISALFERVGESGFREIEAAVIRETAARQGVVIATGGGAILRRENTALLKENGRVYFLDRPFEALQTTADRPLSSNRDDLLRRYNERYTIYRADCDRRIVADESAERVARRIYEDFYDENMGD